MSIARLAIFILALLIFMPGCAGTLYEIEIRVKGSGQKVSLFYQLDNVKDTATGTTPLIVYTQAISNSHFKLLARNLSGSEKIMVQVFVDGQLRQTQIGTDNLTLQWVFPP